MYFALLALLLLFGGLAVIFHRDRRREHRPTRDAISDRVRLELEVEARATQERREKFTQIMHEVSVHRPPSLDGRETEGG